MSVKTRLLIVGYGNMARAILKGFAKNVSKLKNYQIQITGRDPEKIRSFLKKLPFEVEILSPQMYAKQYTEVEPVSANTPSYDVNIEGYRGSIVPASVSKSGYRLVVNMDVEKAVVLLTIKPHALKSFNYQGSALLVLSALAGVSVHTLKECIESHAYVRCMPNIAASYGLSATSYYVETTYNPRYATVLSCQYEEEWRYKWLSSEFPHDFLLLGIKPDPDLARMHECVREIVREIARTRQGYPTTHHELKQQVLDYSQRYLEQGQKPGFYSSSYGRFSCNLEEFQAYVKDHHERFAKLIKEVYISNFARDREMLVAKHQAHLKSQVSAYVREILKCFGGCVEVQSESLIDASLATNGSSLAFLSMVAQGLISAGVREGLSVKQASSLVKQSFKGFAKLLVEEQSPQAIIDSICTPGGATIAGLSVLEDKAFKGALMQACHAAVKKGRTKFN
ncbi:pyrroline-5-carboxylate reductase dimerization domain-containing protein [Helicobacter baculiformis]|uniref:Pyrroline-5-carboxylate reductase n=1 Tax=Helicobacter baculiformis TaxID=427351 RepID=A0ABV7ZL90_9HELI